MAASTEHERPPTAARVALALACAAQFMVVLDVSVVNVALPSVRAALDFDAGSLQWVVNAYALVFAGFLLLGGRLADLYGRKRVFVVGLALFSAASLVGGLASTQGMLIAARATQGLGAAVLAPATLTILTTTFPEGPRRTRALAAWTAVGLAGGTAGNLVGGLLTESLSWRWILLINVPVGATAIVLAVRFLAQDGWAGSGRRLDLAGAALATVGLVALTYGLAERSSSGATRLSALAIGLGALALFVVVEIHSSDAGAASGLMNTTKQVGGALGLALLVAIAASHVQTPEALAADYGRAFLAIAAILVVVAAAALALPAGQQDAAAPDPARSAAG